MKLLIGLLAAAGLTGCASYDYNNGYASTGVYYGSATTYTQPAYGYYNNAPVYVTPGPSYRDRDGDGVPNAYDRRPDDPRRY